MADNNLRSLTLGALRRDNGGSIDDDDQITLDPSLIERERTGQRPITVGPARQYRAPDYQPGQPLDAPLPEAPPEASNLKLGLQQSAEGLTHMIYGPASHGQFGHLPGGGTLADAATTGLGIDPELLQRQLANQSSFSDRAVQFVGGLPLNALRYGMATAAAGGDPVLGAGAADALGADTPEEAVKSGLASALMTGVGENIAPAVGDAFGNVMSRLPSQEELQVARDAANARLRASGIYATVHPMAQFLDPATIRDMAISTGASLGSGVYSAAEIAAAKARQIQELIRRPIEPTPDLTTPGRDVLARSVEDLEQRIPNEQRVVSPDATRLINGQPFSSVDMNTPSEGYLPLLHLGPEQANDLNNRMWQDAIQESELPGGSAAMQAVRKTGARPPTAEFLDRAMSLPQRARYWYELSGSGFTGDYMDIPPEKQPGFIDLVAGTSGGAKPYANLKRAIGSYSENLQNQPIYTDLRDQASVRNALNPALERLGTHKYQNFSGTMQYVSGLGDQPPLSVNDVQMAKMFGIKGSDIGKNPALYEVLSRYMNKVRDAQNSLLPEGAQPWETWQVQAPAWVRQRLDDDPESTYDDYAMVFPKIIQELNDAGIPTPNGKVTMATLMDPRTPNAMSTTREALMGTPVGTVEFATTKTPAGAAAAQTRKQLEQLDPNLPWVQAAKDKYELIQRNAMRDFAMRHDNDPSYVSQLMSEIVGRKLDVSRLEWNGYGTYEGDINPNLRIPMGGGSSKGFVALTQPQREFFLSILGQDLNQDGMAASHFTTVPDEHWETLPADKRTYSVWMRRYDDQVDQPTVQEFSRQIGYPVNVARVPNGVMVDVNVGGSASGPTREAVENAAKATFGNDPNVQDLGTIPRSYSGDFVHNSNYQEKIDAQRMQKNQSRGSGSAGNPPVNFRNIGRIRRQIQRIAQEQDANLAKWHAETQATIASPPRVRKPKLPPGGQPPQ